MGNEASLTELADDLAEALHIDDHQHVTALEKDPIIAKYRQEAPSELVRVADWIASDQIQRILVVAGAGMSVGAGIPDFRTPGTGLYDNLQKYNLPYPQAVFDLDFFRNVSPQPFGQLASELWPGLQYLPTLTHSFLTLLEQKGKLLRVYTQNIDGLEHLGKHAWYQSVCCDLLYSLSLSLTHTHTHSTSLPTANLSTDVLVECHGHFRTASGTQCGVTAADITTVQHTIVHHKRVPTCESCGDGYVKPDIVFFGEDLPSRFHHLLRNDLQQADACLILGTSLAVAPVSGIPDWVNRNAKRILLNRELVGNLKPRRNTGRDVFYAADCDVSTEWIAKLLGWWPELQQMHTTMQDTLRQKIAMEQQVKQQQPSTHDDIPPPAPQTTSTPATTTTSTTTKDTKAAGKTTKKKQSEASRQLMIKTRACQR
jgi:NAD-dependent SIR2 family protein deacetylase